MRHLDPQTVSRQFAPSFAICLGVTATLIFSGRAAAAPQTRSRAFVPQWELITPVASGEIADIEVDVANIDDLVVSTVPDGTWHSSDGGLSDLKWLFTGNGLFEVHMTKAAIAESDNLIRYAHNLGGAFRRTEDGGNTWLEGKFLGAQSHVNKPWVALAVSPLDPLIVLGGGGGRIVRSTDGGASPWSPAAGVPGDVIVTDIEYVPGTASWVGDMVWASTARCALFEEANCSDNFIQGRGVLWSADGGQSWAEVLISPVPGDRQNLVNALATIPNPESHLFAATNDGLWGTANYGATWVDYTPPGLGDRKITDVFLAQSPSNTIYISTPEGVYRGDVAAGGTTWFQTAFPSGPDELPTCIESTRSTSSRLYVGYADGGLYRTSDYGVSVSAIKGNNGSYPMCTIEVSPDEENAVYMGTSCQQGFFKGDVTGPNDVEWQRMYRAGGNAHFHYAMRIVASQSSPATLYATENDWLWKSVNRGQTWTLITPSPGGFHLHGVAVAPSDANRLYVSNGHGNWGSHTPSLRVFRSDNAGAAWSNVSSGLPQPGTETSLYDISIHPADPDVAFIATFGSENYPGDLAQGVGQGVLRTLDGGLSWSFVNGGLTGTPDSLFVGRVAMSETGGVLRTYIATLDGLYKMEGQASSTWVDISPATERRFEAIEVDPSNPSILYAGSSAPPDAGENALVSIYVSKDGGNTWKAMPLPLTPLSWSAQYRVRDIVVAEGRAYAVVEGSGVYMLDRIGFEASTSPSNRP